MTISRMQQPRQMYQEGGIMPRLNQLGSGVSSAEQMLQGINQRLESAESSLGEGGEGGPIGLIPGQPVGTPGTITDIYGMPMIGPYPRVGKPYIPPGDLASAKKTLFDKDGFRAGDQRYGTGLVGGPQMAALPESSMSGGPMQSPLALAMRSMAAGGGMMGRQNYGLGSLVKSITKGVKSAVKGVADVAKSPLGLAAIASFVPIPGLGGKTLLSKGMDFLGGGGLSEIFNMSGKKNLLDTAKVFAGGSLLGGLLSQAEETGDPEGITRNVGALKAKLADAYRNQRTFADEADEEAAIAKQVEIDTSEYTKDMARGYAQGGRIGYALGTPEQNAMKASGIMGLPLNQNPAGVTELDLRETGGFIPPVGVKEKADDIPAMLSNNEFVFTADAVRGMGDGNVNKGAQRLYDQMKMLEKGGRV